MKPVKYKSDMYSRWLKGEFGNRLDMWPSLDEWKNSGFSNRIGLRYKVPGSPFCRYNIEPKDVESVYNEFISLGADSRLITFCEAADDTKVTCQGEVQLGYGSYDLYYSTVKEQMRPALSQGGINTTGLSALIVMKTFIDPASLDDIKQMLIDYPGHVIEWSAYNCHVGNMRKRNTLIWEVRAY